MDRTISSGLRLLRLGYNLKAFGALLTEQLCAQRTQPLVLPLRKLPLQKLQLLLGSGVTIWPWAILSYALILQSKKALVILLLQRLFGTIFAIVMVLQLLIRIRLYLCRLDYIFYCTYRLGYPYCPSLLGRLIVLSLLFPLGTFLLFPMDYCLV